METRLAVLDTQFSPRRGLASRASGALLAAEDDFELGSAFHAVWLRACDRIAGFLIGCTIIAAVWAVSSNF